VNAGNLEKTGRQQYRLKGDEARRRRRRRRRKRREVQASGGSAVTAWHECSKILEQGFGCEI
jgi:hypothetical protein